MKKIVCLSLLLALGTYSAAGAQQSHKGHGKGPGHRFDSLDRDQNGLLTLEEMRAGETEHWSKADANKDGIITQDEIAKMRQHKNRDRFAKKDKNNDGSLSRDEVPRLPQALFDKIDANKDGLLSQTELSTVHERACDKKGKFFGRLDANGDGQISKAEMDEHVSERFKQLDLNGDGAVDREEMKEARPHKDGWSKRGK